MKILFAVFFTVVSNLFEHTQARSNNLEYCCKKRSKDQQCEETAKKIIESDGRCLGYEINEKGKITLLPCPTTSCSADSIFVPEIASNANIPHPQCCATCLSKTKLKEVRKSSTCSPSMTEQECAVYARYISTKILYYCRGSLVENRKVTYPRCKKVKKCPPNMIHTKEQHGYHKSPYPGCCESCVNQS